MTSIKIKFKDSFTTPNEGILCYQIIHRRTTRQLKTTYKLFKEEWNQNLSDIIYPAINGDRSTHLRYMNNQIRIDLFHFQQIVNLLKQRQPYTIEDVVSLFQNQIHEYTLFKFMNNITVKLRQLGRMRTSEAYHSTLNSFMHFRNGKDVIMQDIDSDLMESYEAYLKAKGITLNSISFYMRILRAVYNRAVEKNIIQSCFPFKHVYTGIEKTTKRAISLEAVRNIKKVDLSKNPLLDMARDIFLFSFYTRGMSFVDISFLRKKDVSNGILSYRRRKTGTQLHIKWEKCMQDIVDKYDVSNTIYLLPIIKDPNKDSRLQYMNKLPTLNRKLKDLAKIVGISMPLTMYVARHSWASIAKNENIPISVISESMGHDSEMTTQIYLASLDTSIIDRANKRILELL